MNKMDIEKISEAVHNAWWDTKVEQGFHSPMDCPHKIGAFSLEVEFARRFDRHCDKCHKDMYPYDDLPEDVKEYDRVTVRAVLKALDDCGFVVL